MVGQILKNTSKKCLYDSWSQRIFIRWTPDDLFNFLKCFVQYTSRIYVKVQDGTSVKTWMLMNGTTSTSQNWVAPWAGVDSFEEIMKITEIQSQYRRYITSHVLYALCWASRDSSIISNLCKRHFLTTVKALYTLLSQLPCLFYNANPIT